jgi:hypothetical protein
VNKTDIGMERSLILGVCVCVCVCLCLCVLLGSAHRPQETQRILQELFADVIQTPEQRNRIRIVPAENEREDESRRHDHMNDRGVDKQEQSNIYISLQLCKMNDARASHINANQGTIKAVDTSKLGQ